MTDRQTNFSRLAAFIRESQADIIRDWTAFARTRSPASDRMSKLALQNHIVEVLDFITADLETSQTLSEQVDKSHGYGPPSDSLQKNAAETHAAMRLADGFTIEQMISEYRALRASVVRLWAVRNQMANFTDLEDLTRFNEAIDQAVTESVAYYTKTINDSRNLFLGVLGHDLRNPVGAAYMGGARWLVRSGLPDAQQARAAAEIVRVSDRAIHILNDLLVLARSSFGTELSVVREEMDLGELCHDLQREFRALQPDRKVEVTYLGETDCRLDRSRMGQVISNLISNALQYGDATTPVRVHVRGDEAERLTVSVQNFGRAISSERMSTIFQSWMRGQTVESKDDGGTHLGLGLYIAKLIVEAHGGTIHVTSNDTDGTTFNLSLPRR